jgi:DNA-directed RNA polymerase specialized sigma24 family protein
MGISAKAASTVTFDRFLDRQGQPFPEDVRTVLVDVLERVIAHPDTDIDAVVDRARVIGTRAVEGRIDDLPRYLTKALFAVAQEKRARSIEQIEVLCPPCDLESLGAKANAERYSSIEAQVLLDEVLAMLSPLDRKVYMLHSDGFEHREIAKQLGISESMSWLRLRRAKSRLASWLKAVE